MPIAGFHHAVGVGSGPGQQGRVLECGVALVDPEQVVRHVVGHIEVDIPIIVEIGRDHAEAGAAGLANARCGADVGELAVAQIAIQKIRTTLVDDRRAIGRLAEVVRARLVVGEGELHIVGDVEIGEPVAIDVREAGAHRPALIGRDVGSVADVAEAAIAEILEQLVGAEVGDEDVEVAIVVDVARGDSHAVAVGAYASAAGHVHESQPTALGGVAVETIARQCRVAFGERPTLHQPNVHAAIAVEVEDRRAGADDLDEPALAGHAVVVVEVEPGALRDVLETDLVRHRGERCGQEQKRPFVHLGHGRTRLLAQQFGQHRQQRIVVRRPADGDAQAVLQAWLIEVAHQQLA